MALYVHDTHSVDHGNACLLLSVLLLFHSPYQSVQKIKKRSYEKDSVSQHEFSFTLSGRPRENAKKIGSESAGIRGLYWFNPLPTYSRSTTYFLFCVETVILRYLLGQFPAITECLWAVYVAIDRRSPGTNAQKVRRFRMSGIPRRRQCT